MPARKKKSATRKKYAAGKRTPTDRSKARANMKRRKGVDPNIPRKRRIGQPTLRGPNAKVREHAPPQRPPLIDCKRSRITWIMPRNPKKRRSDTYRRFGLYEIGMTLDEAFDAGVRLDDIRNDVRHDYIAIDLVMNTDD